MSKNPGRFSACSYTRTSGGAVSDEQLREIAEFAQKLFPNEINQELLLAPGRTAASNLDEKQLRDIAKKHSLT